MRIVRWLLRWIASLLVTLSVVAVILALAYLFTLIVPPICK